MTPKRASDAAAGKRTRERRRRAGIATEAGIEDIAGRADDYSSGSTA
jgi:hypothetical protein